jgi:hypothetical protein
MESPTKIYYKRGIEEYGKCCLLVKESELFYICNYFICFAEPVGDTLKIGK